MRRLTVTEPGADTLEVCFDMTGKEGAARLATAGIKQAKAAKRLQQVSISPCAATELKVGCQSAPSCITGVKSQPYPQSAPNVRNGP